MNNQISRRNLIKLLGVSGIALPLSGLSKPIENKIFKKPKMLTNYSNIFFGLFNNFYQLFHSKFHISSLIVYFLFIEECFHNHHNLPIEDLYLRTLHYDNSY